MAAIWKEVARKLNLTNDDFVDFRAATQTVVQAILSRLQCRRTTYKSRLVRLSFRATSFQIAAISSQ